MQSQGNSYEDFPKILRQIVLRLDVGECLFQPLLSPLSVLLC